jgi:stage II sporulation protein P
MTLFLGMIEYILFSDCMRKRFKTRQKHYKSLLILFFIICFISYESILFLETIYKTFIAKNDALIVETILDQHLGSIDIANLESLKSPSFIIQYMLNTKINNQVIDTTIELPIVENDSKIILYIYNSHPTENYSNSSLEAFSINPTVVTADYILQEYLENNGLKSLVETRSVAQILKENNWKYGYSYKASRLLLESAYQKNNSLMYFIDIHRDSAKKTVTTLNDNGLNYARLMFVVGKEYNTYEKNYQFAKTLNTMIDSKIPGLSRGVLLKSGPGVNGVYNQDFNENCMLIEIGGQDNTIDEINNTIKVLADVISEYIGGKNA